MTSITGNHVIQAGAEAPQIGHVLLDTGHQERSRFIDFLCIQLTQAQDIVARTESIALHIQEGFQKSRPGMIGAAFPIISHRTD
jgi:hypothetical protein